MMEKNTIVIGIVALIFGVGIGYAVWGSDQLIRPRPHMMSDGALMSQNIDQHFMVQMIPHHEGAIAMAKIARERSKRPEILSLAAGIIEAQERENTDMRAWYKSWFGSVPPEGGMGMSHVDGMEGDTSELLSVPEDAFDREFLEQMIPHHEMAIVMAQMLQASTERNEMRILADNIITSQAREIEMMQGWLKIWYRTE